MWYPDDSLLPKSEILEELERLDDEINDADMFLELYPDSKDRESIIKTKEEWIERKKVLQEMLDDSFLKKGKK